MCSFFNYYIRHWRVLSKMPGVKKTAITEKYMFTRHHYLGCSTVSIQTIMSPYQVITNVPAVNQREKKALVVQSISLCYLILSRPLFSPFLPVFFLTLLFQSAGAGAPRAHGIHRREPDSDGGSSPLHINTTRLLGHVTSRPLGDSNEPSTCHAYDTLWTNFLKHFTANRTENCTKSKNCLKVLESGVTNLIRTPLEVLFVFENLFMEELRQMEHFIQSSTQSTCLPQCIMLHLE